MDPMSALSVAAAVIQFLDFGGRLLSETYKVYRSPSGKTENTVKLSVITKDLTDLTTRVENRAKVMDKSGEGSSSETFLRLCSDCNEISWNLKNALDQLQGKGTKKIEIAKNSFIVAVKSVWSENKIRSLEQRLSEVRQQVVMAAVVCLWEEEMNGAAQRLEFSKRQDTLIQRVDQIKTDRRLGEDFVRLVSGDDLVEANRKRQEFKRATITVDWKPGEGHITTNRPSQDPAEKNREYELLSSVIRSLHFASIADRESIVPLAYAKTFEWVFQDVIEPDDGQDRGPKWASIPSWLESDSGHLYWITGKPGSGKSTLMKFILENPALRKHLQLWAGDLPVITGAFYFWSGGTTLQKSQKGLLRTLLHQCLNQMPSLAHDVCPNRLALVQLFGSYASGRGLAEEGTEIEWEWDELLTAMNRLTSCAREHMKLALFIDGLDEFEGDPQNLVDLVKAMSTAENVKICVSSRPWNVFVDAFGQEPNLRLELLTRHDISKVIQGRFESSRAFSEIRETFPRDAGQLITSIAEKAEGVFLWVTLVVTSLLEGLMEGDKLSDLQARLNELPSDLDHLFQKIHDSVDPRYGANSSALLQILNSSLKPLGLLTMWLADEEESLERDVHKMPASVKSGVIENMRRRLNSRTRGLLDASPSGDRVDFLHRTVRDWMTKPEIWANITAQKSDDFDPNVALCKAYTVQFPQESLNTLSRPIFWNEIILCMAHAARAKESNGTSSKLIEILDRLDSRATQVASSTWEGNILKIYKDTTVVTSPQSHKQLPHWSTTERADNAVNCFLGLAAQCGVLPYVKAKVEAGTILNGQPSELSVLESAIYGYHFFNDLDFRQNWLPNDEERRKELVRILLLHGADPRKPGHNGRRIIDDVHYAVKRSIPNADFLRLILPMLREAVQEKRWGWFAKLLNKIRGLRTS